MYTSAIQVLQFLQVNNNVDTSLYKNFDLWDSTWFNNKSWISKSKHYSRHTCKCISRTYDKLMQSLTKGDPILRKPIHEPTRLQYSAISKTLRLPIQNEVCRNLWSVSRANRTKLSSIHRQRYLPKRKQSRHRPQQVSPSPLYLLATLVCYFIGTSIGFFRWQRGSIGQISANSTNQWLKRRMKINFLDRLWQVYVNL